MRLYRWFMVLLLPRSFRREFGEELLRAVSARLRGVERLAWAGLWLREMLDLVRTALREWTALGGRGGRGEAGGLLEPLWRDARYAARALRRAPGFSIVVVLTLALGIGANSAIFSVVNAVLLEKLPYVEPDRLVSIWEDVSERGGPVREWFSYPDYQDVEAEPGLLEATGAWATWGPTMTGVGGAEVVPAGSVSHDMFSGVFRLTPAAGRLFTPEDDVEGGPGVVVLTYRSWRQRFGGAPSAVGQVLTLDDKPFTVVGVLPEGFRPTFVPDAELFRALATVQASGCSRGCFSLRVLGRLAPGVSLKQAQVRAAALGSRLAAAYPETNTKMTFAVFGLLDDLTKASQRGLWVLLGAVGFVLLIAATNVANLVLARAATRQGELGVRVALGAGRAQVVRHLLAESLLLAGMGGLLGLGLGAAGTRLLLTLAPAGAVPRLDQVGLDARVVAFTAAVTILTGLLFGLTPAWRAAKQDVQSSIRAAGRGSTEVGGRMRAGLAVLQVGLALVLLVGAGLLLRSFQRLTRTDLGFAPTGVLTFQVGLTQARYPDAVAMRSFYFDLLTQLRALPGVQSAGAVNSLPLAGQDGDADFLVEGEPPPAPGVNQAAWIRPVTDGYFETVGLRLIDGRMFLESDDTEAPRVVIVNRMLADRYYAGNPVGKRLAFGSNPTEANWRTIIGVAENVRHFGIRSGTRPAVYFPYRQVSFAGMALAVRTSGDPGTLIPQVRRTLADIDPAVAGTAFQPLSELVDAALAPDRFVTMLLTVFAGVALLIAAVGIYGVISYGVSRRTREMGIRMAMGADARSVRRLVVGGGLRLVVIGVVLGLGGAYLVTGLLGSLLFDVTATDPFTFAQTTILLTGVAVLASWIPARRASRADPVTVLREE